MGLPRGGALAPSRTLSFQLRGLIITAFPVLSLGYFLSPLLCLLPQLASASAQVSPQCQGTRCLLLLSLEGCWRTTSGSQQGELFEVSLISETIGGWKEGKTEVMDGFTPRQNVPGGLRKPEK